MKHVMTLLGSLVFSMTSHAAGIFDQVTETAPQCFEHAYTEVDLAKRPKQSITNLRLTLLAFEVGGEKYQFVDVTATLKDKKYEGKTFHAEMSCSDDGRCWIDCDGGQAKLVKKNDQLFFQNKGITLHGGCGEIEEEILVFLKPTRNGDDVFDLTPAQTCSTPKWFTELVESAKSPQTEEPAL